MNVPHVLLYTDDHIGFSWKDDLSRLTRTQLESLLIECRHAVTALEAETDRRQLNRTPAISTVDFCWRKLQKKAEQFQIRQRLDDNAKKQIKIAIDTLHTSDNASRKYREFLQDILHDITLRPCGPEFVILCATSLGKHRIAHLKEDDRVSLLDCIKTRKQMVKTAFLSKIAKDYRITTAETTSNVATGPHHAKATLPLDAMGASIILAATQTKPLTISLPSAHDTLPYIEIPHEICADIMRMYTS
ncbi:conserved hypothetical protein [Talaromyces marneffei ATCC 18224]|uniref:Uncharacterized protein n=1 Tax=Talaromyces marneffei (strain ATCC 18224 / CBS 334.59 / QM 7333) TaxID=441960 RepID=B6QWN0_TALMQ|nr:conserved hypothetical protein [Talaromyces marneffei ATCC 18224]